MQKILLLLAGGSALGLSRRPDTYFRILRGITKEWRAIERRRLHEAIRNLYSSQLVDCREHPDGTASLVLTNSGKERVLHYDPEAIKIKRPKRWDGLWRVVMFDIPELQKRARDALSFKLRQIGFYPMQKSVFVHPYDCKDEIDFLIEFHQVRPHVRFLLVKETDIDLKLKQHFHINML
ncbi:MAG: hypothetical protein Q7R91_02295 [bacterium]|nr:hypothetical protein [bacterium]